MDSRIGKLNNGQFYAFVDGYDAPEFRGTLEEVEVALGLREKTPEVTNSGVTFSVMMTLEFPAWDEVNGIDLGEFRADNKSSAIAQARRKAFEDGHATTGKGRYWLKAEESL